MAINHLWYDDVKDPELHAAVLKATAPKDPPTDTPCTASEPVKFIALKQIAVSENIDDEHYGLFGIDYLGRLWRLYDGVWLFAGAPRASDIPPGW